MSIRIRTAFSKTEAMRFTGHLDLHTALERTMRRANLPLSYSQGFNPRPKITLASALPLGFTSEHELVDFWLDEDRPLDEVAKALHEAAPPGIIFHDFQQIDLRAPKLQTIVIRSSFRVTLPPNTTGLDQKVASLLATEEILIEKIRKRKKRVQDLRPLILDLQPLPPDDEGCPQLSMTLQAREGATGRPDDILAQMDLDPLTCRVHRTETSIEDNPTA